MPRSFFKTLPLMMVLLLVHASAFAGEPLWVWMKGDNHITSRGVYGNQGVASIYNTPSARESSVAWSSGSNKLWMFGGWGFGDEGAVGELNDLWSFDTAANCWTWIGGSKFTNQTGVYGFQGLEIPQNMPGARWGGCTWTGNDGRLWLFGGYGFGAFGPLGDLNDLWSFNPATGNWTWISGSNTSEQPGVYGTLGTPAAANTPGSRHNGICWTGKDGRLWLFGGFNYNSAKGYFNDLWCFDPATARWTWVKGSNTVNQGGVYGTLGTAAAANTPGARIGCAGWIDKKTGRLWLFGGFGGAEAWFNDLWRFDPATGNWTWVKGDGSGYSPAVYGTRGSADVANNPGARQLAVAWTGDDGRMWLFGGYGQDIASDIGYLNDLWSLDPAAGRWTWVKGGKIKNQFGVYNPPGTVALGSTPGGRESAVAWTTADGRPWLFGGKSIGPSGAPGDLNDLWCLTPMTAVEHNAWSGME